MNFDYDQFMHEVITKYLAHSENQRYGQFMVNYLYEKYPDIYVPQHIDPFYDNSKVPALMHFLFHLNKE